jgi:hypothetical protein
VRQAARGCSEVKEREGGREKVFVRRCGCIALRMFAAEAGGGRRGVPRRSWCFVNFWRLKKSILRKQYPFSVLGYYLIVRPPS